MKLTLTQRLSVVFALLLLICSGTSAWLQVRSNRMRHGSLCWEIDGFIGFDNLAQALLTLFICVTFELWHIVMYLAIDATDIFAEVYQAEFREEFANQIGKYNVQILDSIKDLYLHDFGIFIEVSPDEEEKQQLEANIQMALSRDQIALEDAIDIREIKNLKVANQLLKVKRKDKEKKDMEKQQMMSQFQSQSNIAATQAAAEAKMAQIEAETQSKIRIKEAESMFSVQTLQQEAQIKLQLMQQEFQMNMQLKGIDASMINDKEKMKEEAKDKRISIQNTQQSKLIEQRKNNLPPVDFESNEDTLDGFSLASFEPK